MTKTSFSFGDDISKLGEYAWYSKNSDVKTHPVGQKKPNAWDLYDMHGNVWEWVKDDWQENYKGAPIYGGAWVEQTRGPYRVICGRGWYNDARSCQAASRAYGGPNYRHHNIGFRLSRSVAFDP